MSDGSSFRTRPTPGGYFLNSSISCFLTIWESAGISTGAVVRVWGATWANALDPATARVAVITSVGIRRNRRRSMRNPLYSQLRAPTDEVNGAVFYEILASPNVGGFRGSDTAGQGNGIGLGIGSAEHRRRNGRP